MHGLLMNLIFVHKAYHFPLHCYSRVDAKSYELKHSLQVLKESKSLSSFKTHFKAVQCI